MGADVQSKPNQMTSRRRDGMIGMILLGALMGLPASAATIETAAPAVTGTTTNSALAVPDFSQVDNTGGDEFLPVEQAFALRIEPVANQAAVRLVWDIAPNYSLYRDRIKILSVQPSDAALTPLQLQGEMSWKQDPNFGKVAVFHGQASSTLGLYQALKTPQNSIRVQLQYQGCADTGLCFPPVETTIEIPSGAQLSLLSAPQPTKTANAASRQVTNAAQALDTDSASSLANFLASASVPLVLLTLLVLGAGLAFTPCVFPMMPILSGLIAGEKRERLTGWRGFQLSLAYVLGMASTYAIMGTLMGYFGAKANVQLWLQQPIVLISFAGLFVLLALGMFGLYTIQLPAPIRERLDRLSNQQKGGRLGSVAAMGALSALVVSPCVSAPLAGVLVYISATGDAVLGAMSLFSLGLGMGIPLMILGTTSAKLLPRAGGWMDQVKGIFGVGLLAVAVWLVSRVWTGAASLWLWGALLGGYGVWLGAFEAAEQGVQRLIKAAGLGLCVLTVFLWIGAATGQDDPLRPLGALSHTAVAPDATKPVSVTFENVTHPEQLQAALDQAKQAGQAVVVDISADWCAACQVMEKTTFRDSRVIQAFASYRRIRMDLSQSNRAQREWLQAMHLYGPPALLFFDSNGQEIKDQRIQGEIDADHLMQRLP